MKPREHKQMQSFSDFLTHCEIAAKDIKELEILNDCKKNLELISKLPDNMINRWKRESVCKVCTNRSRNPKRSNHFIFARFKSNRLHKPQKLNNKGISFANGIEKYSPGVKSTENHKAKLCLYCNYSNNHSTHECRKLASIPVDQRQQFITSKKLCLGCLRKGHMTKECRNRATCEICQKRHPTATHRSNQPATQANNSNIKVETVQVNEVASNNNLEQIAANTNNTVTKTYGLCSMVVPILYLATVDNPDEEVLTYALLDSMSDTTFVTNQVVREIPQSLDIEIEMLI
ncbi:hypothetical protein EB796_005753 [Bugula neritina]|uniref:CCHC-type domain-containing protein n=1 Tax=Bugula neritina TaxID=10212 RepID=A0A7J7KBB9_BUGNE|nr:hypothetical protein EB796_005753 [Bugula neritina]